ncbi:20S-pre-rRNA D-site endonuclease nob1 [Diatrype stigma]|uniref:20S-pre-rRNA D-site endonuclease NOB1 n=1 Tax=Diatrype stigma TaxID=117547 RepID=A0AAN9U6U9_9PEZI
MATTLSPQEATPPPAIASPETTTTTPTTTIEPSAAPAPTSTPSTKPIHSLILDAGPLIKNDPPVSTLLAQAHELYTIPSVIESEIRDAATRARVETTLVPFLKLREPRPASVRFVRDFARRTGDLDVLSRPDIALLALAYELECERNGGDWRLRSTPGQKGVNGRAPGKAEAEAGVEAGAEADEGAEVDAKKGEAEPAVLADSSEEISQNEENAAPAADDSPETQAPDQSQEESQPQTEPVVQQEEVAHQLESLSLAEPDSSAQDSIHQDATPTTEKAGETTTGGDEEEDDDEEGWITPSNLKQQQEKDRAAQSPAQPIQRFLQVALLTSDYAMQNVLLRMNLNLVSPALARITRVKTWVLRCHGCFQVTRDTSKQFCPRCGQPTLTRVSASTDQATGGFTLHLKTKGWQWNNRGNVYSVPKPVHGSASGKAHRDAGPRAGGQGGWGRDLIFAEDQKEYVNQKRDEQRKAASGRDPWDDDYLPSILSGDRKGGGPGGKIKVGAGRSVNARKRR